jgi:hypothetical protein
VSLTPARASPRRLVKAQPDERGCAPRSGTFPDGSPRQDWAVWVVKRLPATGWTRVAELRSVKEDDTSASFVPDDRFGHRLAFDQSGETLAVAAPCDGSDETRHHRHAEQPDAALLGRGVHL